MPRSQPSTVEKLTGDFLKLTAGEQTVVLGVFGAIAKAGVRRVPEPPAVRTGVPLAQSAQSATTSRVRSPRRRIVPVEPVAEAAAAGEVDPSTVVDTE